MAGLRLATQDQAHRVVLHIPLVQLIVEHHLQADAVVRCICSTAAHISVCSAVKAGTC